MASHQDGQGGRRSSQMKSVHFWTPMAEEIEPDFLPPITSGQM